MNVINVLNIIRIYVPAILSIGLVKGTFKSIQVSTNKYEYLLISYKYLNTK